jgi:ribonuclease Z
MQATARGRAPAQLNKREATMSDAEAKDTIARPATEPTDGEPAGATTGFTRREALKLSGLTLGGLAVSGTLAGLAPAACQSCCDDAPQCDDDCCDDDPTGCSWTSTAKARRYSYFDRLRKFAPVANTASTIQPLDANAMRITLMGTAVPPRNLAQRMVSVFVEVGWQTYTDDYGREVGVPLDQFIFDCGTGSSGSYNSMNVGYGRMNKVFVTHLHADHTGDLDHVYCFGPSGDRKSPLWVWGPGPSGVRNPAYVEGGTAPEYYDDGTAAFCSHLRDAYRWHTESFSFQYTAYPGYPDSALACDDPRNFGFATDPDDRGRVQPPAGPAGQYGDDAEGDAYALMPVEIPFDWSADWSVQTPEPIIVYDNASAGVRISAYPVIHARKGAVSYKLEWTNPNGDTLSMIFTGDTKPERLTVEQAANNGVGIDVLIHEMGVPPEVWAMKAGGFPPGQVPDQAVCLAKRVQNSSHTPQGAFGYLLSRISPFPGLTVATHFPTADDTVQCAMKSLKEHLPKVYQGERPTAPSDAPRVTFAMDLMVITVDGNRRIREQRGDIDPFGYQPTVQNQRPADRQSVPKYHCPEATDGNGGDPLAQINTSTTIWPCDEYGDCNYRDDGY